MLTELKLLHLYLGALIAEIEAGRMSLLRASRTEALGRVAIDILVERLAPASPPGCDHEYRRIASGEYECRVCGAITDEPDV